MKHLLIFIILMTTLTSILNAEPLFNDGSKLIFPRPTNDLLMSSAVIVTKNKHVIVFDGGLKNEYVRLTDIIKEYSDTVDYWFLTHIHNDHCGAICELFQKEPNKLKIKNVMYTFPTLEWIHQYEPWSKAETTEVTRGVDAISWPKSSLHKGDVFEVDGVKVNVLNDIYLDIHENAGNNSSIVFRVEIGGKRLLVPGDIGVEGSEKLMKECGQGIEADIVMLSHHGQNGATKEFYAATKPSIVIWETPNWLWDNNIGQGIGSGPWKTNYVKCWMQELGIKKQYRNNQDIILE